MARYTPTELITGFYADETMLWSQQDCVNWLPSVAEQTGTRTPVMAKTPPGLSPLAQLLDGAGASVGPVRGLYEAEGRLFTVIGTMLYQVSNGLVMIPLGTIPGTGKVRFAHNKIDGGNQVLAVNGSSGFVWNTADEVFTKITDSGYPGAFDAVFIDGYLIQIEPGRRFAFHSDLSDALAYNTLDRFTSEVSPDALVAMAVANNELLLLSETTGEFFHNTGATVQPFRSKRISFDKGCAGRYAIATLGSTPFWLGNDGMFYAMNGYSPQRISTRPIEQAIRDLNWSQAIAFVWETEGHSVVYWTFPDGYTFGYDVGQPPGKQWHRRASYGLDRWRVAETAYWRNDWVASDFQYSRLYTLDQSYAPYEYQTPFVSELVGGCIHDNQNTIFMPYAEFIFDTGQPDVTVRDFPVQPAGPTISGAAPDGVENVVYGPYTYTIVIGDAPISTVAVKVGVLPAGLTINNAGTISGTPTETGTFPITVRVTDTNGLWDEVVDSFDVEVNENLLTWTTVNNTLGQSIFTVHVADGDIVVGCNNNSVAYSINSGVGWTTLVGEAQTGLVNAGLPALACTKYNGIWYLFNAGSMSKSVGDTFTFTTVANPPEASARSAIVLGGTLYVGVNNNDFEPNVILRKMVSEGDPWTQIDTGIVAGSSTDTVCGGCAAGGAFLLITEEGKVLRTTDFATFTKPLDMGVSNDYYIATIGNATIAAGGDWRLSSDGGLTWGALQTTPQIRELCATATMFIGSSGTHVYTSPDGITWTDRYDSFPISGAAAPAGGAATDGTLAALARTSAWVDIGTP